MSDENAMRRVAVIVPQRRNWLWHQRIVSSLQLAYRVDVYTCTKAQRYPLTLKLLLHLESFLFGDIDLVKSAAMSGMSWSRADNYTYAFILNLSEAPIVSSSIYVIEPRYDGCSDSLNLFAALLARKNPYLSFHIVGQDEAITASYPAIGGRVVLSRGLQFSFARLLMLANRTAHHVMQGTRAAMLPAPANAPLPDSNVHVWRFLVRLFLDKSIGRLKRQFQFPHHWSVALLRLGQWKLCHVLDQNMTILPDDGRRFFADPFLFAHDGKKWLFVEEYVYKSGKGIISCAQIKNGYEVESPAPVLERPYHLSYPFVFRQRDEIYLIPETAQNRTVELYQARSFPFDWTLRKIMINNVELFDVTLLRLRDVWWLFAGVGHEGGSPLDELAIYYSSALEGPWNPHPLNPVKSDCRSARPAGRIFLRGDRLLRPAQNCEMGYGSGLVWLEIEELTPTRFREREIAHWPGTAALNAEGLHTFNCDEEVGVLDIRRILWKWPIMTRRVRKIASFLLLFTFSWFAISFW